MAKMMRLHHPLLRGGSVIIFRDQPIVDGRSKDARLYPQRNWCLLSVVDRTGQQLDPLQVLGELDLELEDYKAETPKLVSKWE